MDALKLIFFSLFTHFAIGALLPLLFISINEIGTKFFRFISGLSIVLLLLSLWAHPFAEQTSIAGPILSLLMASILFNLLTIIFLVRRGKTFVILSTVCGLAATSQLAFAFPVAPSVPNWLLASSFVTSALMLGSVLGTMITGHWYLVNRKLTMRPLQMATWVFLGVVGLRLVLVVGVFLMTLSSPQMPQAEVARSMLGLTGEGILFWARVSFGLLMPLVLGKMIWDSVEVQNTQSATGILYAAIIFVIIGEAFSKYLYLFTGVPV